MPAESLLKVTGFGRGYLTTKRTYSAGVTVKEHYLHRFFVGRFSVFFSVTQSFTVLEGLHNQWR